MSRYKVIEILVLLFYQLKEKEVKRKSTDGRRSPLLTLLVTLFNCYKLSFVVKFTSGELYGLRHLKLFNTFKNKI